MPADGVAASASTAAAAGDGVQPAARAPSPGASVATPALPADERTELARRMKADWCGFGAAERNRQTEAVFASTKARDGGSGMAVIEELRGTAGGQVMEEALAEVRGRWRQALMQRGDERSLAVADYLEAGASGDGAAAASARLQARARTSTDPMVMALALQRPCAVGACVNVEASQWSRLEPANLQAWLALAGAPASAAVEQANASYALDRIAQEARYSRAYSREVHALLTSLPQTHAPGLQNDAEIELGSHVVFGWPLPRMRSLLAVCRASPAGAGMVQRSETVARLLVQQQELLYRTFGLAFARAVIAARPAQRPQWEAQAREYEAVQAWRDLQAERAASEPAPATAAPTTPCAWQPEMRRLYEDYMTRGEWERLRDGITEAGMDEAALSALWRKREGRSALDPAPAPQPASAPAKAG